ncbi:hypothetical protein BCV70DRAFT_53628 [Testicularia cyperi]|uniref:non-specific serine/threonine protein kinase n=1 Tax=Testicularia cyperi TaxID=1882483 RepID=A0A317XX72_9BASI|nr:hypothetical protein BCV70DRAFT_53628 [Testicularia cyperi]
MAAATSRPQGARPMPSSSSSGSGGGASASPYYGGAGAYVGPVKEAAWYEHEERMRPSYIQQPPPLSPSSRYNYAYAPQNQPLTRDTYYPGQAQLPQRAAGVPAYAGASPSSHPQSLPYQYQHPVQAPPQPHYNVGARQQQQQQQQQPQQLAYQGYGAGFTAAPPTGPSSRPPPSPSARYPNPHLNTAPSRFSTAARYNDADEMPRSTVKGSAFMHKGFWDIMSLVNNQGPPQTNRLAPPTSRAGQGPPSPGKLRTTLSKATGALRKNTGDSFQAGPEYGYAGSSPSPVSPVSASSRNGSPQKDTAALPGAYPRPLFGAPSTAHASNASAMSTAANFFTPAIMGPRAQKKRISVDMVSAPRPASFVHAAHASDAEQAEEILLRWSRDGVGKVADPNWVEPIKEALRMQAARNQAEAVAQVQAALHSESLIQENPRQLQIVNGAPSQISMMTTTTATAGHSTLSGNTIRAMQQYADGNSIGPLSPHRENLAFTGIAEEVPGTNEGELEAAINAHLNLSSPTKQQQHMQPQAAAPIFKPPTLRTNTAGTLLVNPSPPVAHEAGANLTPDYLLYRPPSPTGTSNRNSRNIDGLPSGAPHTINAMFESNNNDGGAATPTGERPNSMIVVDGFRPMDPAGMAALAQFSQPIGAAIRPSLETVEKSVAAKIYFENLYYGILKKPKARDTRRAGLEAELAALRIPETSKEQIRQAWIANETRYLRDLRARVNVNSFLKLKTIGHGAFGVVALCKERQSGQLYAMKQLRKADMLRKGQEGHVRAERDLMTSASASASAKWIVKLVYSFQDVDHLYLIMEFMGGGDLLNLLIEKDIFEEDFARFYVAEMILAIHEAHSFGYIHRDIKPDNFLYTSDGHIKLADFGLCQSFHWAHDGAYYDQQRKNLLKKHGIDLEDSHAAAGMRRRAQVAGNGGRGGAGAAPGLSDKELSEIMSDRNPDGTPMTHVLTWREKNKKKIAYSVVGTNNYMAPEVLRGLGYDQACDWWSLGVIVFEMLFGYPPFVSKSRHLTRQKILNWKQTLRFPPKPRVSRDAQDFISRLVCEREDRLGSTSSASVSRPNSYLQSARRSGFTSQQPGASANGNGAGNGGFGGLQDGVEELMQHPWFRGIDWDNLHRSKPPFQPALSHPADTKHFEDDIEDEPLPAPGAADNPNADQPRDPMLRDREQGPKLLEMRKQLAFMGYTFKSPKAFDPREQLADERNVIAAERAAGMTPARGRSKEPSDVTGSRIRSMSM